MLLKRLRIGRKPESQEHLLRSHSRSRIRALNHRAIAVAAKRAVTIPKQSVKKLYTKLIDIARKMINLVKH
jgi:hypothetical protein